MHHAPCPAPPHVYVIGPDRSILHSSPPAGVTELARLPGELRELHDQALAARDQVVKLAGRYRLCASYVAPEDGPPLIILLRDETPALDGRIAELEEANRALEDERRELEVIFESSIDGIVISDGEGRFEKVNASYARIAEVPVEDLVGKTVYELARNGVFSPSCTQVALERKKPSTINQFFRGGAKQTLNSSNPLLREDGSVYKVVTNVRDMSEVHALREELEESRLQRDHYAMLLRNLAGWAETGHCHRTGSAAMRALYSLAHEYAQVDAPVLITGESGAGKDVMADFIHKNSARKDGPLVKINCGAVPEHLLEAEFFGYEGGAFTGARKQGRAGLFEAAAGGTLFLDEVGELPLSLQVKLLRFVENKEFYRLGGNKLFTVDARIISATNRNLPDMVAGRAFREDLFYRLNVLALEMPALRNRREDIPALALHFLERFNARHGQTKGLSARVQDILGEHDWPGNIRELEHLMERLVIMRTGDSILPEHLPESMRGEPGARSDEAAQSYREALEAFEAAFWSRALRRHKSFREAARALGVNHATIVRRVARYGLR